MNRAELMPIERVVLIHGMNSTPKSHWYPSFVRALSAAGALVEVPPMPSPETPDAAAWHEVLTRVIGAVDERTLLVGHSLGNAAMLRYLTALDGEWNLGGIVTVAGFGEPLADRPATAAFVAGLDLPLVGSRVARAHSFISCDDPVVPVDVSERFAAGLGSEVHFDDAFGHYRDRDGVAIVPQLEVLAQRFLLR